MSTTVTIGGTTYTVPSTGELSWGDSTSTMLIALAAISGAIDATKPNSLTADATFGSSFGLISIYLKSASTLTAAAGVLRLRVGDTVSWRNTADDGDLALSIDGSDLLNYAGVPIPTTTSTSTLTNKKLDDATVSFVDTGDATKQLFIELSGATTSTKTDLVFAQTANRVWTYQDTTDTVVGRATTDTLTNKSIDSDNNTITNIVNADIKAGAAIDAAKIGGGAVSTTEYDYLNGVTSAIQTQINSKEGTLTNSAGLLAALSDETGTGVAVFNDTPTLLTPSITNPTGMDSNDVGLANVTNVATDDTAYNTTTWNANLDAPTKNAVRDQIEVMITAEDLNTTHRGSDGTDHSDVVLNTTHSGSNGTDHANVVLNDAYRTLMTTRGDLLIRDASNVSARLGVGTINQVLGTNGVDIIWVSPGGTPVATKDGVTTGTITTYAPVVKSSVRTIAAITFTFVDGDVTVGTDKIAETGHGMLTGDKVQFTTSGTLPAGMSLATDYYIIASSANDFQIATTLANAVAGTQVDITAAAGGGTHTLTSENVWAMLDADGFDKYIMTTGAVDHTLDLGIASTNTGRVVKVFKADSGAGAVIMSRAIVPGSDTINGDTTVGIASQYEETVLTCDGSEWFANYQSEIVTLDSQFTGGERAVMVTRNKNVVTITGKGIATHSSATDRSSSSGLLPTWARPTTTNATACFFGTTVLASAVISTSGVIQIQYGSSQTTTITPMNITFTII